MRFLAHVPALLALPLALALPACASTGRLSLQGSAADPLVDVFDRVHRSVVTVRVVARTGEVDQRGQMVAAGGIGSGVLISKDGLILTAAHVVQIADAVTVEFPDGTERAAKVLSTRPSQDVALIQLTDIPPKSAVVAQLGNSDLVATGSRVFVVGAPLGISHTLTVGHLSARRLSGMSMGLDRIELFQTDAAINQGNSGGPMFSMDGKVIGVVSHIASQTGGSEGLGFAVTSNVCRAMLLEKNAFWSGLDGIIVEGDLAAALNAPGGQRCLLVQHIAKNSPTDRMGMRAGHLPVVINDEKLLIGGDLVIEVLGISLGEPDAKRKIESAVRGLHEGDQLRVIVFRAGERVELSTRL